MKQYLSVCRRFFASVIDIFIAFLASLVMLFLFAIFFPDVVNVGAYIGVIDVSLSRVMTFPYQNVCWIGIGEMWTIIVYTLALSLTQFAAEVKYSATLGIKLLGGITMNDKDNPITRSDSVKRFWVRVVYYPIVFCFFTHILDICPMYAVLFVFVISFMFMLKSHRSDIEKITSTYTIQRNKVKEE